MIGEYLYIYRPTYNRDSPNLFYQKNFIIDNNKNEVGLYILDAFQPRSTDDVTSSFRISKCVCKVRSKQCEPYSLIPELQSLHKLELILRTPDLQITKGTIPASVTSLSILIDEKIAKSYPFKSTLEPGSIPPSVTELTIDHLLFKHDPLALIPESVVQLKIINWSFKANVDVGPLLIPSSVRVLNLRGLIKPENILHQGYFPSTLTELDFLHSFFHSEPCPILPGVIPPSVKVLVMKSYKYPLEFGVIPYGVQELKLDNNYTHRIHEGFIPDTVTSVSLGINITDGLLRGALPTSVTRLKIWVQFNELDAPLPKIELPPNLEYLDCNFNQITNSLSLPVSLQTIVFRFEFLSIETGVIPEGVTRLEILSGSQIPIRKGFLPSSSLRKLKIEFEPQTHIPFPEIPPTVVSLNLRDRYRKIDIPIGSIPDSVLKLKLGTIGGQTLYKGGLPSRLEILKIDYLDMKDTDLNLIEIPSTIKRLEIQSQEVRKKYSANSPLFNLTENLFLKTVNNRLVVKLFDLQLLSLDSSDSFIYFVNENSSNTPLSEFTFNHYLSENVKKYPNKTALIVHQHGIRLTYQEFQDQINYLSAGLIDIGVRKGDYVAIWSSARLEPVLLYFSLAKIGAISVNLYPYYGEIEFKEVMSSIKCKGIIISEGTYQNSNFLKQVTESLPTLRICIQSNQNDDEMYQSMLQFKSVMKSGKELMENGFRLDEYQSLVSCHDPSQIVFTSGTTGKQKAIVHSQFSFINCSLSILKRFPIDVNDTYGNFGQLFHINGKLNMLSSVIVGATMVFITNDHLITDVLLEIIDQHSLTALHGTPTTYFNLVHHPNIKNANIKSLKKIVVGGSLISRELTKMVKQIFQIELFVNVYGMSETLLSFSTTKDTFEEKFLETVGTIIPHCSAKIIDSKGVILPKGEIGQLCVQTPYKMLKYFGDENKTKETIVDGWVYTGDLAKFDQDDHCIIIGRMDDTIMFHGINISPKEIEDFLDTHPKIKSSQVFGIPDKEKGQVIVSWIILKQNESELTLDEIKTYFQDKLSFVKFPKYIEIVTEFPLNRNSKPNKRLMKDITIKNLSS
eukprot:gene4323-5410_t